MSLAPLSDAEWPPAVAELRSGFAGGLNVYRVMAHDAPLLAAWAGLREHIVRRTALGPIRAEIVILRVARYWRSAYEQAHHVARAAAAGIAADRIAALCGPLDGVDAGDLPLAAAVDGLLTDGRLDASRRDALLAEVGAAGALDLMATIGMYTTLALVANTFEVPIDVPA